MFTTAEVWVGGWLAGVLQRTPSGMIGFRPARAWAEAQDAPVLGQRFLDQPHRDVFGSRTGDLPCFFSNLLPQGVNRNLVVERYATRDELTLLVHLGADLLGDVQVCVSDREIALNEPETSPEMQESGGLRLTASLTGMQPKFSMSRTDHGFVIPARGHDGDWIVKLPGARRRTPEIEYATMTWAARAGLGIPEIALVSLDQVRGVPMPSARVGSTHAYACRRFDRPRPGVRVHQEDFFQILGLCPHELQLPRVRYRNHESQGRIISALCPEDLPAWLRWLVFNILCGNSDAHQKNLTLLYPDGRRARLAPSYDLLAQIVYPDFAPELELSIRRVRAFRELDLVHLLELGRAIDAPFDDLEIRRMVEATRQAWSDLNAELPLEPDERARIEEHLRTVPLARRLP